jgi:pyochelin biosynthesis protein PchC
MPYDHPVPFRTTADPWLRRWPVRPEARIQLVCFPHAGGSASAFRAWSGLLPAAVELVVVQYPGREDRFGEPMVDDMATLVGRISDALARVLDRPHVLFGHSMGSAVAYETAQELRSRGVPGLRRLVASGREAPVRSRGGDVHRGDDNALCAELARLGGTAAEVLADAELRRAVLGYVRNDYRLIETYRPLPASPLGCPVTVFTGTEDPELSVEDAAAWAPLGDGRVDVQAFPGGHFYLGPGRAEVVTALLRRVDPALLQSVPGSAPSTP